MTEPTPPAIPGMTTDTHRANPVNALNANVFPIGAALTVAYGSDTRFFATLGNVYRVLGYLTGDVPAADSIGTAIEQCREWVTNQLPTELRTVDPPPADTGNETADIVWLVGIVNKYGLNITLTALPGTINNPETAATAEDSNNA